jgi:single-stranded-DNA-specific exonuclease
MFLCQPLLEVLAGRGIEDLDAFLKGAILERSSGSFFDSFDGESRRSRTLRYPRRRAHHHLWGLRLRWGLGAHILRSVLSALGTPARTCLPHRDEGYGLSSPTVHRFSCSGTDLLITVDNGINARAAVELAQRLGIDVLVIDHHRIQEQAETAAVWSEEFCGAGLAAMFAWALALRAGWNDAKVERLLSGCSQYAAIASIADCVPLLNSTRTLARLGLAELSRSRHKGLQELLKSACTDPSQPDSRDVAFGVAPRINAAGRITHPAEALAVFEAALDEEAARRAVNSLNQLNLERQRIVKLHFEELVESIGANTSAGLVVYHERSPKGIAGLLASKCVERYTVPSIVLVPSTIPGQVVGSGRSVPGVDLVETLRPLGELFVRFGGHAQAIGLTMSVDHIEEFREKFARSVEPVVSGDGLRVNAEAELALPFISRHFEEQLLLLEPFGEGNRPPTFSIRMAEILSFRNRWVRIRQGRNSIEALCWDVPVTEQMKGDFLVEFSASGHV